MNTEGIVIDFTDGDSYAAVLGTLEGWTVKVVRRDSGEELAPVVIHAASRRHGLLVADADETGAPLSTQLHSIDFDDIARVTIL